MAYKLKNEINNGITYEYYDVDAIHSVDGIPNINIDATLSQSSVNPVQNKIITMALNNKADITSIPASANVSATGILSFVNNVGTQLFTVQLPLYTGGVD